MSANRNASFPSRSGQRIVLRRTAGDSNSGDSSQEPEGIVVFPPMTLEVTDGGGLQPVACIATNDGLSFDSDRGCWVHTALLDRVVWSLVALNFRGTGEQPLSPPQIEFAIRSTSAGVSDLALAGISNFSTYEDRGAFGQASGVLCAQWEFWAAIITDEPVGTKLEIQVAAAADRTGGGVFDTRYGQLGSALPT